MSRKPNTKPSRSRSNQSGFILLELIIAATLAALTLIVVLYSYSTAFDGSERTEKVTIALLAAETKLAELGVSTALQPGTSGGRLDGGYEWRAEVRPYGGLPAADLEALPVLAYEVEVTVSWGSRAGQAVSLSSLSLAAKDGYAQTR